MGFTNQLSKDVYKNIYTVYGKPDIVAKHGKTWHSVTWKNINGLHGVEIHNDVRYKWHPYPAPVIVYAYKYIKMPELLIGPLKYASETIKIDEIDIPYSASKEYHRTGKKEIAKVYGSCASVIISAITIKFVEDMVKKYKKTELSDIHTLYPIFRNEYDNRIKHYIDTKEVKPSIPWIKQTHF